MSASRLSSVSVTTSSLDIPLLAIGLSFFQTGEQVLHQLRRQWWSMCCSACTSGQKLTGDMSLPSGPVPPTGLYGNLADDRGQAKPSNAGVC